MTIATVLILVGCDGHLASNWESQRIECDRSRDPGLCLQLAQDARATPDEREVFYTRACQGGLDGGCIGQLRSISEDDAMLGAIAVLGYCENKGKYCDLAVELTTDPRLPDDKRAEYSKRAQLALQKAQGTP